MAYKNPLDPRKKQAKKRWYENNKDKCLVNIYKRRREKREYIDKIKDVPCADCGNRFPPCVMDFDHRDKKIKFKNISQMLVESLSRIKLEIKKCDIVCANCHRIRTWKRKNKALSDNG